jgi:hypothetical protein
MERAARRARIHHAVGHVEYDHQPSREGGHRDVRELAESEQQQEQREHGGRRRGAEKIDDEFERAIDVLVGAQHDPDRHAQAGGNGEGVGDPRQGLQEIARHCP